MEGSDRGCGNWRGPSRLSNTLKGPSQAAEGFPIKEGPERGLAKNGRALGTG